MPYLRAVTRRYLRDPLYEKDVLQESFVKIFKSLQDYDPNKGTLKKWATRVVINTCFNYNDRIIKQPIETWDATKYDIAASLDQPKVLTDEQLLALLRAMPSDYARVFMLFIIEEYSHEEIAEMIGISQSLCRKRLSRAKVWLKKTILNPSDSTIHYSPPLNYVS